MNPAALAARCREIHDGLLGLVNRMPALARDPEFAELLGGVTGIVIDVQHLQDLLARVEARSPELWAAWQAANEQE